MQDPSEIVCLQILNDGRRHPTDHKIKPEYLKHTAMYHLIHWFYILPALPEPGYQIGRYSQIEHELLNVQGIHLSDSHISYRERPYVAHLDPEKRAAHYIRIRAIVNKKLYRRYQFQTLLYLVKKDQSLPGNKIKPHKRGYAQKQLRNPVIVSENLLRLRIVDEIYLGISLEILPETPDCIRLAGLSGTGQHQCFLRCLIKILYRTIYFSI